MILIRSQLYSIYFGDARDEHDVRFYSIPEKSFLRVTQLINASFLYFLKPTHSISGVFINNQKDENFFLQSQPFDQEGDWIATHCLHLGIGVLTADCLPIVLYDSYNHISAVIHAGWRGTVAGIVPYVLKQFVEQARSDMRNIHVWFGPSAGVCCYEVEQGFVDSLSQYAEQFFIDATIQNRNNKFFFDVPLYNQMLLEQAGVNPVYINRTCNHCTIENAFYSSYRRNNKNHGRQMTVIVLH
jgi:polyphenol oxidase